MNLIQILMTPNVVINNILICIFGFLEIFLYEKFFTNLLKIRPSKKQSYTYILIASLIAIITNLFVKNPFSYLINLISFFIFMHFLFKQNIRNSCIAMVSTYISIFISVVLAQTILNEFMKINYIDMVTIPLYHIITSLLIYTIFSLVCILLKKRKKIFDYLQPSLKVTVIINLILGISVIFINSYIISIYHFNFSTTVKVIMILSLLVYFVFSMYSILRTNKLEQTAKDLETEKIYNKTLSILRDNIRCFKHDFNNIVQVIGGYIDLNDMNGLNKYYQSLLKECKLNNNLNLLNPQTINNPSIYSLLNNKYYQALQYGITMNFEIFSDLSTINFNIYEFTRILGILLDNAIEAANETTEKIIEIQFKSDSKKQLFIIENSCADNNISTTKIFEKGYSTKKNNSGIGLWKVHNILSKNTNIDLFTTVKNNKFKQELSVFYN